MSGPFPGMDPYLEHPALGPGVHQGLITFMWSALNALLPTRYVASMGERVYVVQPERDIYPDVMVVQHPSRQQQSAHGTEAREPSPALSSEDTLWADALLRAQGRRG